MSEANKKIVEKVNDAFATNDMDAFFALCGDDITWKMSGEGTKTGLDNIRQWMGKHPEMPPPTFTYADMIAQDDRVVCSGEMTMKNKSGEDETHSFCDIYRITDGKIAELNSFVVKESDKR